MENQKLIEEIIFDFVQTQMPTSNDKKKEQLFKRLLGNQDIYQLINLTILRTSKDKVVDFQIENIHEVLVAWANTIKAKERRRFYDSFMKLVEKV